MSFSFIISNEAQETSSVQTLDDGMNYNFAACKYCGKLSGKPKYEIKDQIIIYVCSSCGFHYINYLDADEGNNAPQKTKTISAKDYEYIDKQLHSNLERFVSKVSIVKSNIRLNGKKCLDIGAGGGLFLHLLLSHGVQVYGIEPNNNRVQFAQQKYGITLSKYTLDHPYWEDKFREFFDIVTMWDVIEHVNFPVQTLCAASNLLKKGGFLCIDTPTRDSFYYRLGEISYRLTCGRLPFFLNTMYSNKRFAHKQIFLSGELTDLLIELGFEIILCKKVHELSFPYAFYLARILKSDRMANLLEPVVAAFFSIFKIRNKVIIIGKKI